MSKKPYTTDQKIKLFSPLTTGTGETLTEVTVRVPKRKDIAKCQRYSKSPAEQETHLLHLLTGLTMEDIDELSLADSDLLINALEGFRGRNNN